MTQAREIITHNDKLIFKDELGNSGQFGYDMGSWHIRYQTEQDTPAYQLFHYRFPVLVQEMFTVDETHQKMYGTRQSSDVQYDYFMAQQFVERDLTIPELAEIHAKGGDITVLNAQENLERIFNLVTDHIVDCAEWNSYHINGFDVPIDELLILDNFAKAMYPKARMWFRKQIHTDEMAAFLGSFGCIDIGESDKPAESSEDYKSMLDSFRPEGTAIFNRGNRFGG